MLRCLGALQENFLLKFSLFYVINLVMPHITRTFFAVKVPKLQLGRLYPPPLSRGLVVTHHFLSSLFT